MAKIADRNVAQLFHGAHIFEGQNLKNLRDCSILAYLADFLRAANSAAVLLADREEAAYPSSSHYRATRGSRQPKSMVCRPSQDRMSVKPSGFVHIPANNG